MVMCFGAITTLANNDKPETATGQLRASVENVRAFVPGGPGDPIAPLPRYSAVAGIPIAELLPADRIEATCQRTADGGAKITRLVGTSAWDAPGSAAAGMVDVTLKDERDCFRLRISARRIRSIGAVRRRSDTLGRARPSKSGSSR
jgi:malate/lactate dehydrogenase